MNAVGLMQSKWLPNFAQGPLCSYIDEQTETEIQLSYLYFVFTSFLFIICDILVLILQIRAKKSTNPTILVIMFNIRHHDMTSHRPVNVCIYL